MTLSAVRLLATLAVGSTADSASSNKLTTLWIASRSKIDDFTAIFPTKKNDFYSKRKAEKMRFRAIQQGNQISTWFFVDLIDEEIESLVLGLRESGHEREGFIQGVDFEGEPS